MSAVISLGNHAGACDVAGDGMGLGAARGKARRQRFESIESARSEHDLRTGADESLRQRLADSGGSARHHRDPAVEPERTRRIRCAHAGTGRSQR
jgi:hypothetical protein